jgi:integrase
MARVKLTAKGVARIKAPHPSGKQTLIWDAELKGFGVLVSGRTNNKSFIVQRDLPGSGKTRRLTIGSVAEIDLAAARKEAADVLHGMRKGVDPKHRSKADATLAQVLDDYLAKRSDLSEKSVRSYRRDLEQHLPWLDRPMHEITREMVEDQHKKIAANVAKAGRYSGHAQANATMRALRVLWNYWSERVPSMPTNPVRLARQWFPVPRRERLVTADQLPKFYAALMDEKVVPNRIQADYLLLLLFTGLRREEAARLRWEDIDFAAKVIRIPAASTKAKRKLDLPMTDYVHDLLVARRAIGNAGGHVFPAPSKAGYIAEPKYPLGLIEKATGIEVSAHDLRRTFVTVAESTDISPLALKALVNHSLGGGVTEGYIIMSPERLREPAERVADRMKQLCQVPAPTGGNVKRLRG